MPNYLLNLGSKLDPIPEDTDDDKPINKRTMAENLHQVYSTRGVHGIEKKCKEGYIRQSNRFMSKKEVELNGLATDKEHDPNAI